MSYSEILHVPKQGPVYEGESFLAPCRGATDIWKTLAARHLGWNKLPSTNQEFVELWRLASRSEVPLCDRVALACTWDGAILKTEDVPWFTSLMAQFIASYQAPSRNAPSRWVAYLRSVEPDPDLIGYCWNQTIVRHPWEVFSEKPDGGLEPFDHSKHFDPRCFFYLSPDFIESRVGGRVNVEPVEVSPGVFRYCLVTSEAAS